MAITLENSGTYNVNTYASSHTISAYDGSGTDTVLIDAGYNRNPLVEVSGITADGGAMTLEGSNVSANVVAIQAYSELINNASFNIVCSTPSFKQQGMIAMTFSGVDQTTPIAGIQTSAGSFGTTATTTYTGTAGNMLVVLLSAQNEPTITPSSGLTTIQSFNQLSGDIGLCYAGYIEADGTSQTVGGTLSANNNWKIIVVELTAASAGGSSIKTVNGIAIASVKTVNGIAIASVKTVNGVANT